MNDKLKQQLMLGIVAFNLTVVAYLLYKNFTVKNWDMGMFLWALLIGAGLGLVTGAIGYFVGGMGK